MGYTRNTNNVKQQCTRWSYLTIPYCWQHLRTVACLELKQTKLRDSKTGKRHEFLGLFACNRKFNDEEKQVLFQPGDPICDYIGEVFHPLEIVERYKAENYNLRHRPLNNYTLKQAENLEIGEYGVVLNGEDMLGQSNNELPLTYTDSACLRSAGSMVNHCDEWNREELNCVINAEILVDRGTDNKVKYFPFICANKVIETGDEICVQYVKKGKYFTGKGHLSPSKRYSDIGIPVKQRKFRRRNDGEEPAAEVPDNEILHDEQEQDEQLPVERVTYATRKGKGAIHKIRSSP